MKKINIIIVLVVSLSLVSGCSNKEKSIESLDEKYASNENNTQNIDVGQNEDFEIAKDKLTEFETNY